MVRENVILNQGLRTALGLHPGGQLRDRGPLRTGKGNLPQTPLSSDEPQTQNSWFNILEIMTFSLKAYEVKAQTTYPLRFDIL